MSLLSTNRSFFSFCFFCRMFLIFILDLQKPKSHCILYSRRIGTWVRRVNMQAFCYWGFFCLLLLFFNNTFYDKFLCQPFWPQQHIEMSSLEKTNKQKNDTKQTKKTLQCFLYFICLALLFRTKCPPQSKYNILLTLFFYNSIPSLKILYISFSNTISILDIMSISLKANKLYNTKSPPCYLINAF